jgi:thioredoxin-related protein
MNVATAVGPRHGLALACILAMSAVAAIAQGPDKPKTDKPAPRAAKRASIYDKTADANVQIAQATERAKRNDKRILLMFGGDWCGWCHKLHGLFKTNRDVAAILRAEYELVTIELESPNAAPLLKTCKDALSQAELQKGVGYPFLAVLDVNGKVVTAQRTDELEEGDHHDPKRVIAFLEKWKVPADGRGQR